MDSSEEIERNFVVDSKELATYLTTVQKMYILGESRETVFKYFLNSMMSLMCCQCGFIAELLPNDVNSESKKIFKPLAIKCIDNDININVNVDRNVNRNVDRNLDGNVDRDFDINNMEYSIPIDHPLFKGITEFKPYFLKEDNIKWDNLFGWTSKIKCMCIVPFFEKDEMTGVIVLANNCKSDCEQDLGRILPMKYICASLLKGFRNQSLKEIYENIVNYVSLPILVFTKDPVNLWIAKNGMEEDNNAKATKFFSSIQISKHDLSLFNCIVCNDAFQQLKNNNRISVNYTSQKLMGKFFYDCFPNMIDNQQIQTRWLDMWKTGNKTTIDAIKYYDKFVNEDLYSIEFNKLDQRTFMMIISPVSDQLRAKELIQNIAKTQEEFVGKISHELRTPVNAILSIVSLLYDCPFAKQQGEASNDFRQKLQMMSESSVTLCSLIQDVLDYTQLESKSLNVSYQTFDLIECIDNALSMVSTEARRKHLTLLKYVSNDVPLCVISDPKRLKQILINLLSNAVKFTSTGNIELEVSTKQSRQNNVCIIQFSIKDTGIGIMIKDLEKLFKPFTQLSSEEGGTGLGLVISKHLANLLGGEIWVQSELNTGSTFNFTIKARACSIDSIKEYYGPILKHKNILVVDDNQTSRNKIITYLLEQDIQTSSVENGTMALTYLQSKIYQFDLIITDIKYQSVIKKYHTNIITIGDDQDSDRIELNEDGNQITFNYIRRPIDKTQLLQLCYSSLAKCNNKIYTFNTENNHFKNLRNLKILIVEDDYINRQVLKEIVNKLGYMSLSEVENGQEALEAVKKENFDVILLDLKMPVMNGYNFFEGLKLLYKNRQIDEMPYTIALTASAMISDKQRCLNMGMNQYLAKPIDIADLKNILHRLP